MIFKSILITLCVAAVVVQTSNTDAQTIQSVPPKGVANQSYSMTLRDGWHPGQPGQTSIRYGDFFNNDDAGRLSVVCLIVPNWMKQIQMDILTKCYKSGKGHPIQVGPYVGGMMETQFRNGTQTAIFAFRGNENIMGSFSFTHHPSPKQIASIETMLATIKIAPASKEYVRKMLSLRRTPSDHVVPR